MDEKKKYIKKKRQLINIAALELGLEPELPDRNPSVSTVFCYHKFPKGHERQECLDMAKAAAAVRELAAGLQLKVFISIADAIWAGGDIDPPRLERAVRERLAQELWPDEPPK